VCTSADGVCEFVRNENWSVFDSDESVVRFADEGEAAFQSSERTGGATGTLPMLKAGIPISRSREHRSEENGCFRGRERASAGSAMEPQVPDAGFSKIR
jgi:hypothetical protein